MEKIYKNYILQLEEEEAVKIAKDLARLGQVEGISKDFMESCGVYTVPTEEEPKEEEPKEEEEETSESEEQYGGLGNL